MENKVAVLITTDTTKRGVFICKKSECNRAKANKGHAKKRASND